MRGSSTGRNGLMAGLLLLTVATALLMSNTASVVVADNSGEGRLKKMVNALRSTPTPPPPPEQGPLDNITRFVETVKDVLGNNSLLGELAARILRSDDTTDVVPQHNATLAVVEKLLGNGTLAHLFAGKDKHAEASPAEDVTLSVVEKLLGNGTLAHLIAGKDKHAEASPAEDVTLSVVEKLLGNGTLAHLFAGKHEHAEASPAEDGTLGKLGKLLGKGSLVERADTLRKHMSDVNRTVHLVLQLLA